MPNISKQEEKMVNLQVQLRQNQTELQDYLADLDSWETDIKKKEAQLKSETSGAQKSDLPPVRNTLHKKKLKKKKKEKPVDSNKPKKISGFDFRAWDKFDVDKALEEVDKEEKKETSSSEYETDEEWELERKKHLSGLEKDKGNAFLKKGEYDLAVEAYTKGMEFDATNAILPANRAMALLKQQKFAAAELDCTTSISLDPLYVKAYLRRATARSAIGKLQDSVADFNRVLDLEPTNKQAKSEIERLQKELQRDKEGVVTTTLTEDEKGRVKPIYKPPDERSKKPLIRIPIEEIGLEQVTRPAPSVEQSDRAKQIVDKEKKEFDQLFSVNGSSRTSRNNFVSSVVPEKGDAKEEKISEVNPSKPHVPNGRVLDAKKPLTVENGSASNSKPAVTETKAPNDVRKSQNGDPKSVPKKDDAKSQTEERSHSSSRSQEHDQDDQPESISVHPIPQTSFQFQADFKVLKKKPKAFFNYLQAISPSSYPKLFGQSLDADILVTILKALETATEKVNLYEILNGLTNVKRFSMTAMFLSKKDKTVVKNLMDCVKQQGGCSDQDLKALMKKFDL